ncbi:MAG: hypothetical protein LBM77_05535 [Spirochaetaceae bacterium]|jgi:hypothetical protein|nr:hypothetical protein [Spirochaetaceae bacterium]
MTGADGVSYSNCRECGRQVRSADLVHLNYCSEGCYRKAMDAKYHRGSGSGEGGSSGGGGGIGNSAGGLLAGAGALAGGVGGILGGIGKGTGAVFGGLGKMMDSATAQQQAFQNTLDAEKAAVSSKLDNANFNNASADEIANSLNELLTAYKAIPGGLEDISLMALRKTQKKAILEKVEFGIMKLQKLDPDNAAFFQKKYDEIKGGTLGKMKGLFGKK